MNKYHIFSLISFFAGLICFSIGLLTGDMEAGFFVIIPFIAGSGIFAFLGFIFIFIAFILFMFASTKNIEYRNYNESENGVEKKTSVKGGGVVLIGPIPIVFGSNWKIALVMMLIAVIIIILSIFVFIL